MTPTKDEVLEFQKSKWLQIDLTQAFIKSLIECRNNLILQAEDSISGGKENFDLVTLKLIQAKTLRKVIDYAQKIDTLKPTL